MASKNKTLRFTSDELAIAACLQAQLPEYTSEAELLKQAALLGMLILAPQANRPSVSGQYGGLAASDLAALLHTRLLPALLFLAQHAMLPLGFAYGVERGLTHPDDRAIAPTLDSEPTTVDPAVAQVLHGLGAAFLDDEG